MKIYKITNKINGKIYIGQTEKALEERLKRHFVLTDTGVNRYLYDAIRKYGKENFSIELIEECSSKEQLDNREKFWIVESRSNIKSIGYNMTPGGGGGNTLVNWPENKKKELWKKQGEKRKGRVVTDKTRQKISQGHKGKAISETQKIKISETLKRKYSSGEIEKPINPMKGKFGKNHHFYGKHHTSETKQKLSNCRLGKKYEDIFKKEKAELLKNNHRERWQSSGNPNYITVDKNELKTYIMNGEEVKNIALKLNISYGTVYTKVKEFWNISLTEARKQWKEN